MIMIQSKLTKGIFLKLRRFLSYIKYKIRYLSIVKRSTQSNSIPKDFGRIGSYPYISGDTFLSISDAFIINKRKRHKDHRLDHHRDEALFIKSKNEKNIIFIENDLLSIKWVFDKAKNYKKVILHNCPIPPNEKLLYKLAEKKIHIFGTNLKCKNKYIETIPLGIENAYMENHGDLSYFNPINLSKIKLKKKNILLISFSIQNNPKVRKEYISILKEYNYKNKYFRNLKDYRKILSCSYFVISPPGVGIDCHRTWEAFIHKTIPVIEKKYDLFPNIELPILVVNNIKEFLNYTDEKKLKIYKKIMEKNYEKIYANWWINFILSK